MVYNVLIPNKKEIDMKYQVKQLQKKLIENFDDRMSPEFHDYFTMTSEGSVELTKKNDKWFRICEGFIDADSKWGAFNNGNIGERTFSGHSISTGDVLIDESGREFVLRSEEHTSELQSPE